MSVTIADGESAALSLFWRCEPHPCSSLQSIPKSLLKKNRSSHRNLSPVAALGRSAPHISRIRLYECSIKCKILIAQLLHADFPKWSDRLTCSGIHSKAAYCVDANCVGTSSL